MARTAVLLACVSLLLSACGPAANDTPGPGPAASPQPIGAPTPAPTPPQIAFRQNREDPPEGNFEIYTIRADPLAGTGGAGLTNLTNHPARDECPYWSPDGQSIAFVSDRDGGGIYLMESDGSNQHLLTAELTRCEIPDATMAWSPDGEWLAFVSCPDGPPDIYAVKRDGSQLINLTHNPAADQHFSWSPDGDLLAFGSDRDGDEEIHVLDAKSALQGKEDATLTQLTDNTALDVPAGWSPDASSLPGGGTRLVFLSDRDGNPEIYVVAVDPLTGTGSSAQTRLTTDPALDLYPAWSPTGRWIAFISKRDGNQEVYVMSPDGSGQRNLTASPATDAQFWWSRDGSQIAVSSMQDGAWSTWIIDVEGTGRRQLDVVGCLDWRPR